MFLASAIQRVGDTGTEGESDADEAQAFVPEIDIDLTSSPAEEPVPQQETVDPRADETADLQPPPADQIRSEGRVRIYADRESLQQARSALWLNDDLPRPPQPMVPRRRNKTFAGCIVLVIVAVVALVAIALRTGPIKRDVPININMSGPTPEDVDPRKLDAMARELFGSDVGANEVGRRNMEMFSRIYGAARDEGDIDEARGFLRTAMLDARRGMDPADLDAISRLYLQWLKQAEAEGPGLCREVTGRSFFDGVPHMDTESIEAERALARTLLLERHRLSLKTTADKPPLPDGLMEAVSRRTGLSANQIDVARRTEADPARCRVTIAILEEMLGGKSEAPRVILETL